MAKSAKTFLTDWMQLLVPAGSGDLALIDRTVDACVSDAAGEGHTRDELEIAAGGHLRGYIRASIIRSGWANSQEH